MQKLRELVARVRSLVQRRAMDDDMAEQMRFHVEMQTKANVRAGMPYEEARRAAVLSFGSVERFRAECRDERRFGVFEDAVHDARFSLRGLVTERSFAVAAVLALALGVGATTAIYSLIDSVLLRPVSGVRAPEELVIVHLEKSETRWTGISFANFSDLERAAPALQGLAGYTSATLQIAPAGGTPVSVRGAAVAGDLFGLLGVEPGRGRFFSREELRLGSGWQVAVLSHDMWRTLYGGAPDVVGRTIRINAHEFEIIGVAPAEFRGPERVGTMDVWLPGASYGALRHFDAGYMEGRRRGPFRELIGRLEPGATPAAAQAQLRAAMERLVEQHPEENALYADYLPTIYAGIGTEPFQRATLARTTKLLAGVALLVLLIACANVANLLLFRGVRRRGELAVRRALGADSRRLLRQALVEGGVLGAVGGAAGVLLAFALVALLRSAKLRGLPPLMWLELDLRVLGFATALALATGLLFGVISAFVMHGGAVEQVARKHGRGIIATSARGAFTVAQVAACIVLLAASALLLRSLQNLRDVELGLEPAGVTVMSFDLEPQGYDSARQAVFVGRLLQRLEEEPGFEAVSVSAMLPLTQAYWLEPFRTPQMPQDAAVDHYAFYSSAALFDALRIPVLAGRTFTRAEVAGEYPPGEQPVLLSAAGAAALFGTEPAIGRRLVGGRGTEPTHVVIGVVGDARQSVRRPAEPAAYVPIAASPTDEYVATVRSSLPSAQVQAMLTAAVASLDAALPVGVEAMDRSVAALLAEERLLTRLIGGLGLLAALLAAVGIYGVIAYGVAQRRREIGIRAALGARPLQLVTFVSRQTILAFAIGTLAGLWLAVLASRLLETWLFGVERLDPAVYVTAVALLAGVAALAAALPARAAAGADPLDALRAE